MVGGSEDTQLWAAVYSTAHHVQLDQRRTGRARKQPDERRSFSKDLWPAHEDFIDAIYHLQFGWKNPEWGGRHTRYERQCFKNLIRVARRLPLRKQAE